MSMTKRGCLTADVAERLTDAEKQAVKTFLRNLYEESAFDERWRLADEAGVSEQMLNAWLSPRGNLPSSLNLLRLLQATDALEPAFRTAVPTRRDR